MRHLAALCAAGTMLVACQGGDSPGPDGRGVSGRFPERCALPTPAPDLKVRGVPEGFLFGGEAEPVTFEETESGFVIGMNLGLSVQDALTETKAAAAEEGFEVIQEDFEGFEAEVYLRKDKLLGAVQIRTSRCNEASVVFINIVDQTVAPAPPTRTPQPRGSKS